MGQQHAVVGLVMHPDPQLKGKGKWGVTFGAYPNSGDPKTNTCSVNLRNQKCPRPGFDPEEYEKDKAVAVVMGDYVRECSRRKYPRRLEAKARVPGELIRDNLLATLNVVATQEAYEREMQGRAPV